MDATRLRDAWLKGINADPDDSPEIVRAAAALFVMLGRVYVWPIGNFDADLERAITALSKVGECEELKESPELSELVATEIAELKSRRKPDMSSPEMSSALVQRPWWKFW